MNLHRAGAAPYPYVLTACPDGEGSWYSEAAQRDPVLAQQLKQTYKTKFTWAFAEKVIQYIEVISLLLTIIDISSKIGDKNPETNTRAQQLGGIKARVALVCDRNDPNSLRKELEVATQNRKIAVFRQQDWPDSGTNIQVWVKQNG